MPTASAPRTGTFRKAFTPRSLRSLSDPKTQDSFAAPIKDVVASLFGWSRTALEGDTPESRAWREMADPWWAERLGIAGLTPRWALQRVGTEAMRQGVHADVWVAAMERRLQLAEGRVVVSDVRFANEAAAIRAAGGVLVRVVRPGCEAAGHASETSTADVCEDVLLCNDGTLEQLLERVDELCF